jgi:hypothetical protein
MEQELQSDVLADGAIAKQAGIALSSPINLPEGVVLERNNLFSAFQKAADGEPVPDILDIDGVKRDIKIEVQNDVVLATYGSHRVAFPQAALLSENLQKRQQTLASILENNTLTRQARKQVELLVAKPNYSRHEFFAARDILLGAPESFATALREVATKGTLSKKDLLPAKTSHWINLTAKPRTSETLTEFIKHELAEERAGFIAQNPRDAVDVISLTFGGPELVPLEAMRAISPDELHAALTSLLQFPDPFALAGAFEICADMAKTDARFVELGNAVLDCLLGNQQKLRDELTTFAAAFVIATAYLAEHETLRKEPVFWRRLVATTHASLVTRVLGGSADDESSLFTLAMQLSGKTFYLSVLNDAHRESRWRPEWVSQNHLMADVYGRLQGAAQRLGEAVPETWRKTLEDAQALVLKDAPPLAQTFPSILQGWVPSADRPGSDTDVGQMYEDFAREPTLEKFLYFTPLVFAFGFATDAHDAVLKVVQSLRANLATTPSEFAQAALDLAALVAAQNRDPDLADTIAAVAVERLVLPQKVDRLLSTAAVILQCAAARTNRAEAVSTLARRLENLAFVAPAGLLPEALDIFRILQSINEELGVLLGRSIATARLGLLRLGVA